jgi:hypothetical protein
MNQNQSPICQSCGMPLKTLADYGTEADGSKSNKNCSFCYQNGRYINPDISMADMIKGCVQIMIKFGMPADQAQTQMEQLIPTLARWKK